MSKVISAGLLNYRSTDKGIEVLLGKTGGPFWKNVDRSWCIPKGIKDSDESIIRTAKREFVEETGLRIPDGMRYVELGVVRKKDKKVFVWAFEHDYGNFTLKSNTCKIEYPSGSGVLIEINELDEGRYFPICQALDVVFEYQKEFLIRLNKIVK